jgi:hypothetical protein
MSTFILAVLSCVGNGLATGCSHIQGVVPTVCKINNFLINLEREQAKDPNSPKVEEEIRRDGIQLAHHGVHLWSFMNTIMNLRVPQKKKNVLVI